MSDTCVEAALPLSSAPSNDLEPRSLTTPISAGESTPRGSDEPGSAGFFAIDHRVWRAACQLGLNPAVCYLALARGTGPDQRTSYWSTNAIEKRTAISRKRIKEPLAKLEAAGLVILRGTAARPSRYLVPGHEIGITGGLPPLTADEQLMLTTLPIKTVPKLPSEISAMAKSLLAKGYIRKRGTLYEMLPDAARNRDPKPDWVWLPNAIVDGVEGRSSPIEIIRQTGDAAVLRLFVDLYHSQSLSYDGGVPTSLLVKRYTRQKVCFSGSWIAWQFESDGRQSNWEAPFLAAFKADSPAKANELFWDALGTLERLGFITFVEHLFEGPGADAEIIHPFAKPLPFRDVTEAEGQLYEASSSAAHRLCQANGKVIEPGQAVLVREHIGKVELRGVLRLRYRPQTVVTAEWMARSEQWRQVAAAFDQLDFKPSALAA